MEALDHTGSDTTITELMIPAYANFGGKIHGGILLSLMDKVAYACATKHAGNYCVTVSVDEVEFLKFKPSGRGIDHYEEFRLTQEMIREFYPKLITCSKK